MATLATTAWRSCCGPPWLWARQQDGVVRSRWMVLPGQLKGGGGAYEPLTADVGSGAS